MTEMTEEELRKQLGEAYRAQQKKRKRKKGTHYKSNPTPGTDKGSSLPISPAKWRSLLNQALLKRHAAVATSLATLVAALLATSAVVLLFGSPQEKSLISTPPATRDAQAASNDSEAIPLKVQGGTLLVPVIINGKIPLDFTIDSGATDVTIPIDVVSILVRTGTLGKSDFLGQENYVLADGSIKPSATFVIRSLKVGNHVLKNVKASVADGKAELLLGQSFLSRFNSWSIDNKRQVLLLNAPPDIPQSAPLNPRSDRPQSAPSTPITAADEKKELMQRVMTEYYGSYSKEHSCWISNHGGTNYCMKPAHLDIVGSDANRKIFIAVSGQPLDENGQPEDCHVCAAALGLFVLAENGSQFSVVAKNDLFDLFAPYGGTEVRDDAFSVRELGPQGSDGWVINIDHWAAGAHWITYHIYGLVGDSVVSLGQITTHFDNTTICTDTGGPDCTDISGDFVIDANSPANTFYPVVLRASGIRQGHQFEATYRFVFDSSALKYTAPQDMPDGLRP